MKPSLLPQLATPLATSCTAAPPPPRHLLAPVPLACFQFLEQARFPPASGPLHMLIPLPEPPAFLPLICLLNYYSSSRSPEKSFPWYPGQVVSLSPPLQPHGPLPSVTQSPCLIIGCRSVWLVWEGPGLCLPLHAIPLGLRTGLGHSQSRTGW